MSFSKIYSFFDNLKGKKTLIQCPKENSKREIALVIHIYYIDFFYDVILPKLSQLHYHFDLFISTRNKYVESIFSELSQFNSDSLIIVKAVKNIGFDIYPFTNIFSIYYSNYQYICKIHSKKSEYDKELYNWGNYLIDGLIGDDKTLCQILEYFEKNTRLGIIFPDTYLKVKPMMKWGSNYMITVNLLQKMGLNPSIDVNDLIFPAGSMFWFRPDSLLPLFKLSIKEGEYSPNLKHPRDGTLAHAIERSIIYIAKQRGYDFYVIPGIQNEKTI
jgi:lipopolysaccharide biosynthesis protein